MRQRLGLGIRKLRGKATLQLKFSLSYILVIAAVLILLNSYPLLVSQNMMVASNQNNLKSTAKVIESAMIGLEKLTVENVQAALEGLDESGAARIMVTNSAGLVLYDTRQGSNAVGEYALYSVVAVALRGQDASYCSYDGTAFLSRVATPVVYHNQIVGAVYAYDYDTEQSELLETFRHNLLIISLLIALLVAGLSIVLSQMLTRQISGLLQAIRKVREGAYSHRADASGTDEIAQIAAEFNSLTDRLQTTENARRRFVSDASHELKTPITVIATSLKVLEMEVGEQKWIDKAQAQTEKLKELVNSLVTLSRMDEEETPLKFADFDISAALSETADSFNESAEAAGHRLITDIAPDIHYNGDEYAVRQLVSILLDNAVKYASPDSPITLKLERDRKGVVIRSSNGCDNVDAEDTKKLFDRFYRADKARGSGGFGIGLSIARSIAEAHKGSIKAELTDNNTIEFTVHLK